LDHRPAAAPHQRAHHDAYRITDDRLPKGGTIVSRGDVAEFMIGEAEKPAHIHHIVGIAR
jgi:hypothetical protein